MKILQTTQQQQLLNGKSESNFRPVAFEKFPVPTTGGIVVGKYRCILQSYRYLVIRPGD